ncbi:MULTISPECIES: hypothetical protein [Pseudomonas]|nr:MULTISPECIES: hypothetical protein [Pseudomonas]
MTNSMQTAMAQAIAYQRQRPAIEQAGTYALNRLVPYALMKNCRGGVIGRFLLSLYNGDDFPFALTDLRSLDLDLFQDCMHVLVMDYDPTLEVHERVQDGSQIWQRMIELWAPEVAEA